MDTVVSATIAGKAHGLQFHSAHINQGLFACCELGLELGFSEHEARDVHKNAVSSWIGEKLVLTVEDRADSSIKKKYQGIITTLELSGVGIRLYARSEDHLMMLSRRHRSFVGMTVSGMVNEIVKGSVADASLRHPDKTLKFSFFQQYEESDFEVLKRLARYDGCVFFHDGEQFVYTPGLGKGKSVALGLEHLSDVGFRCTLNLNRWRGSPYDFAKHSEPDGCRVLSGSYSPPSHPYTAKTYEKSQQVYKNATDEIYNEAVTNKAEFEQFLKNQQSFAGGKLVKVYGTTNHPMVAVGRTIKCTSHEILKDQVVVTRMAATFSGNVYSATFEANAEASVEPHSDTDTRRHMETLQPAIVVDNKDKDKLGRVQVRYLWDVDGKACAWARVLNAGAGTTGQGKAYGTHYIPRIEDQVLVGCENGDPSLPIVFGALYHSEHKPDFVTENGTEEVLVARTPRESTIRVLDKAGSEEVVISMRDNKNLIRLELKEPKITVESAGGTILVHSKTIELKADEKLSVQAKEIEISAQQNMKTSVGQDLSVSVGANSKESVTADKEITAGKNLAAKAGAQAEIKAAAAVKISSAQVESSAAGTNVIRGALVQIN